MSNAEPAPSGVSIRRLETDAEAEACARLMASTEPWVTLGRTYDASLAIVRDPSREVHLALDARGGVAGFLILFLAGPFAGYLQTVCVAPESRGQGLGRQLVEFAEQRIGEVSPNVFLCVSDFNPRARALYERLGYQLVGELADFLARGHAELLFRKTRGPWAEFGR